MAMFSLNLMRIALELAVADPVYEGMALKFFEHFLLIAEAMTTTGGIGLWNDEDAFFYDVGFACRAVAASRSGCRRSWA